VCNVESCSQEGDSGDNNKEGVKMNESVLEGKNNDNTMEHIELNFNITNNAWINSGLITLAQNLNRIIEEYPGLEVNVGFNYDGFSVTRRNDSPCDIISQAIHNIAARGTYNFSTAFKIINDESGANYTKPKSYPNQKEDFQDTIEILDVERKILKDNRYSDTSKNQKIWKMRMSYLADPKYARKNYLDIGLNLKNQNIFKKLIKLLLLS